MGVLPKNIYIGGTLYKVRTKKNDLHFGETDSRACKITLSPDQTTQAMRETLLHEVIHAISWCTKLMTFLGYDSEEAPRESEKMEEYLCCVLSPWILMTLRDNPELVTFLMEV